MNPEDLCVGCMAAAAGAGVCPRCGWQEGSAPYSPVQLPPRTELLGKYLLGVALGQGGFGITYLAWDLNLDQKLAVKEFFPRDLAVRSADGKTVKPMHPKHAEDYRFGLARFIEEGRILAHFREHPSIVSELDFCKANGTAYLVMQYVDGITFKEFLKRNHERIPFAQAVGILVPVMDALRAVHKAGLLHRDVSPDNIYITEAGEDHASRVQILDFGSTKHAIGEHTRSLQLTHKPGYSPEEQYRTGGKQGPWTDVYAVAATLYRAVTGQLPPEALDRLAGEELKKPSNLGVDIAPEAEKVLLKGLAVRSEQRFQTIQEFQKALLEGASVDGVPAPVSTATRWVTTNARRALSRRRRLLPFAAAAILLAISLVWTVRRQAVKDTESHRVSPVYATDPRLESLGFIDSGAPNTGVYGHEFATRVGRDSLRWVISVQDPAATAPFSTTVRAQLLRDGRICDSRSASVVVGGRAAASLEVVFTLPGTCGEPRAGAYQAIAVAELNGRRATDAFALKSAEPAPIAPQTKSTAPPKKADEKKSTSEPKKPAIPIIKM